MKDMFAILSDIADERARQDERWGIQNHPFASEAIQKISVTFAEEAKKTCRYASEAGTLTWRDILAEEFYEAFAETDIDKQIEEMTQVAAVAVAIIENLERKKHDDVSA